MRLHGGIAAPVGSRLYTIARHSEYSNGKWYDRRLRPEIPILAFKRFHCFCGVGEPDTFCFSKPSRGWHWRSVSLAIELDNHRETDGARLSGLPSPSSPLSRLPTTLLSAPSVRSFWPREAEPVLGRGGLGSSRNRGTREAAIRSGHRHKLRRLPPGRRSV